MLQNISRVRPCATQLARAVSGRVTSHPVANFPEGEEITFTFNGQELKGKKHEPVSTSLIANDIQIFNRHYRDDAAQGIFCANGQCAQCRVLVDGVAKKSCLVPVQDGMKVEEINRLAELPAEDDIVTNVAPIKTEDCGVLIVGGGPAGLSAAVELGKRGIAATLLDDKDVLGGKLVLQTHKFFGTKEDCYAGTRGYDIGKILSEEVAKYDCIKVVPNTTAMGVFSDGIVGVTNHITNEYSLIKPEKVLIATGAREKFLTFPGNTLPGVYGAGAFQTLLNRDGVKPCEEVVILGAGNVGIIGAYHAIQGGVKVNCVIDAAPTVGGYKVHADKTKRLGVPIWTRHTVVEAHGTDKVEAVTIAEVDENYQVKAETMRKIKADCLLIAIGLDKCDEFYHQAIEAGLDAYVAGDANAIAEASSAMFSGKVQAFEIARALGIEKGEVPADWAKKEELLKTHPTAAVCRDDDILDQEEAVEVGMFPVMHCFQEIPCNACVTACHNSNIESETGEITGLTVFDTETGDCDGCMRCVSECPGLAVTVVSYEDDADMPSVTMPYELPGVEIGKMITVVDEDQNELGTFEIEDMFTGAKMTQLLQIQVPHEIAQKVCGIKEVIDNDNWIDLGSPELPINDEGYVCRCERVTAGEIRGAIREGFRDMNEIKALLRVGMGSCGAKTCNASFQRIFREEGVEPVDLTLRPLFAETPIGAFAGVQE
eukprot:TRINITY_DN5393_c0_g1_i1.p1 TRINITY_DN5393_c0_g1~~TRINITY_DN5393_c0_g1_i1.p1  ORF type:complete len:712 (+),score=287.50 TRINITY_DN5393_c0_g1_i1:61-2196(+)